MPPPEQPALVDRVQRINKYYDASKRQSGRDATIAEAGHNIGFGSPG